MDKLEIRLAQLLRKEDFSKEEFFHLTVSMVRQSDRQPDILKLWLREVYTQREWKIPLMPMGLLLEQVHRYYGNQGLLDHELWEEFLNLQKQRCAESGENLREYCLKNLDVNNPHYERLEREFFRQYESFKKQESSRAAKETKEKRNYTILIGMGMGFILLGIILIFTIRVYTQHRGQQQAVSSSSQTSLSTISSTEKQTEEQIEKSSDTSKIETSSVAETTTLKNTESTSETIPEDLNYQVDKKLEEGYIFSDFSKPQWWICRQNTYCRQGCSETYTYFKEFEKGQKVIVLGTTKDNGGWARIYYENGTSNLAYVKLEDIKQAKE